MNYETGMILYGSNKMNNNLWLVYDGPNKLIALLWDGKRGRFCDDFKTTRHDTIRSIALHECDKISATIATNSPLGAFPQWARDLMTTVNPTPLSRPGSVQLSPGVLTQINKALGVKEEEPKTVEVDTDRCPVNGGYSHDYVSYTGLNQVFEFCSRCDHKRGHVR